MRKLFPVAVAVAAAMLFAGPAAAATSERCVNNGKRDVCILELQGSYTGGSVSNSIAGYPTNTAVVIKGGDVSGPISINHPRVTIAGLTTNSYITINSRARFTTLRGVTAYGFDIYGASDVLIADSHFDMRGTRPRNNIYDASGSIPRRIRIARNDFRNHYQQGQHSEALFIGYSAEGRVYSNTFTNGGNTSHIFFTWWGATANPATSYPRSWCLRNNKYAQRHGYYDINHREEIPGTSRIRVGLDDTDSIAGNGPGVQKGACP